MRPVVLVWLAVVALAGAGCADATGANIRPTITIAGLISDSMAQPVPNANLTVQTYAPSSCGTSTVIQEVDAKSGTNGIYRVEIPSLVATFTACIRVTVGATLRDTTVINLPQYSTVQVNVSVP